MPSEAAFRRRKRPSREAEGVYGESNAGKATRDGPKGKLVSRNFVKYVPPASRSIAATHVLSPKIWASGSQSLPVVESKPAPNLRVLPLANPRALLAPPLSPSSSSPGLLVEGKFSRQ
jgi:hypothetical protein